MGSTHASCKAASLGIKLVRGKTCSADSNGLLSFAISLSSLAIQSQAWMKERSGILRSKNKQLVAQTLGSKTAHT